MALRVVPPKKQIRQFKLAQADNPCPTMNMIVVHSMPMKLSAIIVNPNAGIRQMGLVDGW